MKRPMMPLAFLFAVLLTMLQGCATVQLDVDVYKGPLSYSKEVQMQQLTGYVMTIRGLLISYYLKYMRKKTLAQSSRWTPVEPRNPYRYGPMGEAMYSDIDEALDLIVKAFAVIDGISYAEAEQRLRRLHIDVRDTRNSKIVDTAIGAPTEAEIDRAIKNAVEAIESKVGVKSAEWELVDNFSDDNERRYSKLVKKTGEEAGKEDELLARTVSIGQCLATLGNESAYTAVDKPGLGTRLRAMIPFKSLPIQYELNDLRPLLQSAGNSILVQVDEIRKLRKFEKDQEDKLKATVASVNAILNDDEKVTIFSDEPELIRLFRLTHLLGLTPLPKQAAEPYPKQAREAYALMIERLEAAYIRAVRDEGLPPPSNPKTSVEAATSSLKQSSRTVLGIPVEERIQKEKKEESTSVTQPPPPPSRAQKIKDALDLARKESEALQSIQPPLAALKSSYSATALQPEARSSGWKSLLMESTLRGIPFVGESLANDGFNPTHWKGKRRSRRVASEIDKQYWQNINNVRVSGVGDTNYVLAKDDIGNWYVKKSSSDPEKVIQGAKSLALFGATGMAPRIPGAKEGASAGVATMDAKDGEGPKQTKLGAMMKDEKTDYEAGRGAVAKALADALTAEPGSEKEGPGRILAKAGESAQRIFKTAWESNPMPSATEKTEAGTKDLDPRVRIDQLTDWSLRLLDAYDDQIRLVLSDSKEPALTELVASRKAAAEAKAALDAAKALSDADRAELDSAKKEQAAAREQLAEAEKAVLDALRRENEALEADRSSARRVRELEEAKKEAARDRLNKASSAVEKAEEAGQETAEKESEMAKTFGERQAAVTVAEAKRKTLEDEYASAQKILRSYTQAKLKTAFDDWDAHLKRYQQSLEFVGETAAK